MALPVNGGVQERTHDRARRTAGARRLGVIAVGVLAATLSVGVAMYAFLWAGGLPAGLRGPVAAYVLVIALMAAQAMGRALWLRHSPATLVAIGTGFFMLSDALLATHRFVSPLPMSQIWVLGTYYAAQVLIVAGVLRGRSPKPASQAPQTPAGATRLTR